MFGCRINDDMGTELQRLLEKRRGKNIVDDQLGACFIGDLRNGSNVDDFERRIDGLS